MAARYGAGRRNPMFDFDGDLADVVFRYCRERLELDPVPLDRPGKRAELEEALSGLISPSGNDPVKVLQRFSERLAPAVLSADSPRFLAFIPAAPSKAALLFDMLVSCSSLQGTSWLEAAGAIAAENQALRVLAHQAGMPASAGGCFVSGGSAGNLSALVVARDTAAHRGLCISGPPLVAVSDQVHSSVSRALNMIGTGAFVVPTTDHRLTGEALAAALDRGERASDVVGVVATAGTTNAGIVDDLSGIAEVASARRLWLHVDGAYGGAALFSPTARPLFHGVERADSLVIDPHKWLFAPFDCAALLYRDPHLAKAVHTQDASYLDPIHATDEDWNPADYAYHLTRRARGLAFWFSLAVHGTESYRDAVDASLRMAEEAGTLIDAASHLELVRPPGLSIVLFRRLGWDASDYQRWSERLLADQIGFVTPSRWEGETVVRLCFLHPHTTREIVEEILASTA